MEMPSSLRNLSLGGRVGGAAVCGPSWDGSWPLTSIFPSSHLTHMTS